MAKKNDPVQGFMFSSVAAEYQDRDETVCQIRARSESDVSLEVGPAFEIEFSDGEMIIAYSSELRPWYQTD